MYRSLSFFRCRVLDLSTFFASAPLSLMFTDAGAATFLTGALMLADAAAATFDCEPESVHLWETHFPCCLPRVLIHFRKFLLTG